MVEFDFDWIPWEIAKAITKTIIEKEISRNFRGIWKEFAEKNLKVISEKCQSYFEQFSNKVAGGTTKKNNKNSKKFLNEFPDE